VRFGDNSVQLSSSAKVTLNKVVAVLKLYPWMKIAVEAHSDATGYTCKKLTDGRAATAEKYLKSQGVTNPMAKPTGKCGVKMAVVIAGAGGSKQYVSGSKGTNTCSNGKLASASACKEMSKDGADHDCCMSRSHSYTE
jgi:hypothetical protein